MKPFFITQYVLKLLTQDQAVNEIFGQNIYPLNAKQSTKFPFAVMQRSSIVPEYSKDGHHEYNIKVKVICADDNYANNVEGAEAIRNALELRSYMDENVHIRRITLDDATEMMISEAFVQELTFNICLQI
jgi:hypothetical protein